MITFIAICAAMLAAALVLIARPLIREKGATRKFLLPILAFALPAAAIALYWQVGHIAWERDAAATAAQVAAQREFAATLAKLEQRVREAPGDIGATLTLGEALIAQDERSIAGRAGELFESALARAPNNTKALWYGAITALSTGKLPVGRERLQRILSQNPPEQIRSIIERQLQDIDQQMKGQGSPQAVDGRVLNVQVSIAPAVAQGIDKSTALFVLARDPANRGPPLAAVRRTVADLPLTIAMSDKDAMIQGRGISSVPRVEIVARISKTGAPQEQAGDLFGSVTVDLAGTQPIAVKIVIDRKVEK